MAKKATVWAWIVALLFGVRGDALALSGSEVTVLRIGKADAILVQSAGKTVLIDAGEDEDAAEILALLAKKRIKALDLMIITHFDNDHVGGADGILEGISVGQVYDADYENTKDEYKQYVKALEATGVPRFRVRSELALDLGGMELTLLPTRMESDDDNDNSLVISMTDGEHWFLFAADATDTRMQELMDEGLGEHDVLKMPHHGRYYDNLDAFVAMVGPQVAVITDSSKNPADKKTLKLLKEQGIETLQTQDGDIHVVSGPSGLTVTQ